MTKQELKGLGMTEGELFTTIDAFKEALEKDRVKFLPAVIDPQMAGLTAIKHRAKDGQLVLSTISVETALFIRTVMKTYDTAIAMNQADKDVAKDVDDNTPPDKSN